MKRAFALSIAATFLLSSAALDSAVSAERGELNKSIRTIDSADAPGKGRRLDKRTGAGIDRGGVIGPAGTGTTVVYSTNSVKCGNTVYEVSTGTAGGGCDVTRNPGQPTTGTNCVDGGNTAEANCTTGCGTTSGSGSCTIKSAD